MDPQHDLMDLARSGYFEIALRGGKRFKRFVSQWSWVPMWVEVETRFTPALEVVPIHSAPRGKSA